MLQPPQAPLPADSGTTPHVRAASRGTSRLPNVIAIAIAVVALAVAAGAWFRPLPKPEPPAAKTYSEQEVAEAKRAVCEAFTKGQATLAVTGSKVGGDSTDQFAIALNSRISMQAVGTYLRSTLDAMPATPAQLAGQMRGLTDVYQSILLGQLADATHDDLNQLYTSLDGSLLLIQQACL